MEFEKDLYLAHSSNREDVGHILRDHLQDVALLMDSFSCNSGYSLLFRITGLLHDSGKYQAAFQKYLREGGRKGSVPHASLGAAIAIHHKLYEAAFAIDGNHKGLPDKADLKDDCDSLMSSSGEFREIGKGFLLNECTGKYSA